VSCTSASVLHQSPVAEDVEDVMAGVALVATELESVIYSEREIHVERERAAPVSLVLAERCPRLVVHGVDRDALSRWQGDVLQRCGAADVERLLQHGDGVVAWDEEALVPRVVALRELACARCFGKLGELVGDLAANCGAFFCGCVWLAGYAKECDGFTVEGEKVAAEHGGACVDGG